MTAGPPAGGRYVLISPVKDEERFLETTIQSVLAQTIRPTRWILVDDASGDRTPEILRSYAQKYDWIRVIRIERDAARRPGSAVARAFAAGYELAADAEYDFVVKLDCDLDLPADYFLQLVSRFREDPRLGIASGVYLEAARGQWRAVEMPGYHAAGASKMIRKKCFEDIQGFVPSRGWDTVDEIRAQKHGWKTGHFAEITFRHLRNEGAGIGDMRTNQMHGEIYYLTGGGAAFFLLKLVHRLFVGKPFLAGGLAMLWGYLKPWLTREPRVVCDAEARVYRHLLHARIREQFAQAFKRMGFNPEARV